MGKEESRAVGPGITVRTLGLEKLVQELAQDHRMFVMDPKGEPLRGKPIASNPCFILTDHLPMPKTREWFLPRAKTYPLRHTRTRTGNVAYTTVGAVVPVNEVLREVEGAARFRIEEEGSVTPMRPPSRRGPHVRREHA